MTDADDRAAQTLEKWCQEADITVLRKMPEINPKWERVRQLLAVLYDAWAKSRVPWHEEVNELMRAYDKWLD